MATLRLTMKKQMGRSKRARVRPASRNSGQRFSQIGARTSKIVLDAAALLDEEMAAGILTAKRVHERFQRERRIEPADFSEAFQRFRSNAHDIVNTLNDQFTRLRSPENNELIGRLLKNTHDLVDLAFAIVKTGAELASQVAQSNRNRRKQGLAKAKVHARRRR